jgi:hypothetical protein
MATLAAFAALAALAAFAIVVAIATGLGATSDRPDVSHS